MIELNPRTEFASRPQAGLATTQPRRLQIALVLLLVALAVVLVKDREFWFGSDEALESDAADSERLPKGNSAAVPVKTGQPPAQQAATAGKHLAAKTSTLPSATASAHQEAGNSNSPVD